MFVFVQTRRNVSILSHGCGHQDEFKSNIHATHSVLVSTKSSGKLALLLLNMFTDSLFVPAVWYKHSAQWVFGAFLKKKPQLLLETD